MGDILLETLKEFPVKISNKRKIDAEIILGASSLEDVKNSIINSVLNELSYKSPKEFAEEFAKYTGVNLLEKPVYHKYIELKATRDIHIHNSGIANDTYRIKADVLARVRSGIFLPVDVQYFLESYECCLQLTETLEESLNKIWPSLEYQKSRKGTSIQQQQEEAIEKIIEETDQHLAIQKPKTLSKKKKTTLFKSLSIQEKN